MPKLDWGVNDMARQLTEGVAETSPPNANKPRIGRGRPPNAEAGEVEKRILDAATALFMEQGYEGVSFEQISTMAHAGKATIYARYANKEILFSAVIRRSIDKRLALADSMADSIPSGDRLTQTALVLMDRMLTSEAVSLSRVVIGEVPRFPSLARLVDEFGRQRAVDIVWRVMAADHHAGTSLTRRARKAPDKIAARLFMDQLYAPLLLRALIGEDLNAIRGEIVQRVSDAVSRFHQVS